MKTHKYPSSVKRLRSMCKALCSFDKENLRFIEDVEGSHIQYKYPTYPNGLHFNWYDVIKSNSKNKTERYVSILNKIKTEKNSKGFYSSLLEKLPSYCCLEELAINLTLRGM